MGMGNTMRCLRTTVGALEKTWQRWFEQPDPKIRKKLEGNFEYLLSEVEIWFGYVNEEWRSAFKKPKKKPVFDQDFHDRYVANFVPSWEREITRKKNG